MVMRAFLLLLLLGCNVSYAGLFGDSEAREQVEALRAKVKDMEARMNRMEETLMGQALIELHTQAEALKMEMGRLRGQIEVLQDENRSLRKQQKDFYLDLDSRLRQVEPESTVAPLSAQSTPVTAVGQPASVAVVEPLARKKEAVALHSPDTAQRNHYDAAYTLFKQGDYASAIAEFEDYLAQHPQTTLAPAAAYWIGNARYALRDYDKAIAAQQHLIETYPDSSKAPDALLNMASSQLEMGQQAVARKTLENVIANYPYSEAAQKAKNRLGSIK